MASERTSATGASEKPGNDCDGRISDIRPKTLRLDFIPKPEHWWRHELYLTRFPIRMALPIADFRQWESDMVSVPT